MKSISPYQTKKLGRKDMAFAKQLFLWFQEDDEVEHLQIPSNEYISKLLARNDFHAIVALRDSRIVGGLTAYELPKYKTEATEMLLYEIGVEPEHRNKGVGRQLIEKLIDLSKAKQINEMFVPTHRNNTAAKALFESMGAMPDDLSIIYDYPSLNRN